MQRALALALLGLTGCFQYSSVDYTLDLRSNRAEIVYRDLRGDGWEDFVSLMKSTTSDNAFREEFPRASVSREEVAPNGATLELQLDLAGSSPADLGLAPWDAATPYRFCPAFGNTITASNATYRDPDGCLVWKKGTRVLRIHATPLGPVGGDSLLPSYQKWVAEGRPDLNAAPAAPTP